MRYEIEIPDEIDQQLAQCACARGENVVDLIQRAVVQFVQSDRPIISHHRLPDRWIPTGETAASVEFPRSQPQTIVRPQEGPGRVPEPIFFDE